MRASVIVLNPNGAKPSVNFFRHASDAKAAFKALSLDDGESAELWTSTSGRTKRKRGKAAEEDLKPEPVAEVPVAPAPEEAPIETHKPAKRGRNQ